jgi:hydrogenase-1 operon protein HyaF
MKNGKSFPIPVIAFGPGSQLEDEGLAYLPMPSGMATFNPPSLPGPECFSQHEACVEVLQQALDALQRDGAMEQTQRIALGHLNEAERSLLNQVLGEGEVAAQVIGADAVQVQESVFAGVWRVLTTQSGQVVDDSLEVGSVPQVLVDRAREDGFAPRTPRPELPEGVMNAPSLLAEIDDQQRRWQPGKPAHVINLSLLPLTHEDSMHLDSVIGAGRVLVLSRGYGNCRITNTRVPRTWRVTYFNSTDIVILDTLEICRIPEVACAAAEDLADSAERLAEVLAWVRDGMQASSSH